MESRNAKKIPFEFISLTFLTGVVLMILKLTTFPKKIKGLVAALHLIRNIKLAIKSRLLFIAIPTKHRLSLATIFVDFILHCVL